MIAITLIRPLECIVSSSWYSRGLKLFALAIEPMTGYKPVLRIVEPLNGENER